MAGWSWSEVDVAVPRPLDRLPGVSMAGFSARLPARVDMAMVAHPSVTVVLDLSEEPTLVSSVPGRTTRGSIVAGLLPGDLRLSGRVGECLQIRLEPVVAAAVFGAAPALTGSIVSLEDLLGRDAARIEDRLRVEKSWNHRFGYAASVLRHRLADRVDPEVAQVWRRTLDTRGLVRVDGLAGEVGWSRKRLWSRFRCQLGITPKRAAQLVRFDHAAHLLVAGHTAAGVAAESGYADQSHLHREARALTGLTPSAVAAAPWLGIDQVAWRPVGR